MSRFNLETLGDTERLARELLGRTHSGDLVVLTGSLGAGKTALTQQLGLALGSRAAISSPTYTLIHEYPTPEGTLIHIDAYRLQGADTLLELGLEDYLARSRLVVVEWGEALLELFPDALHVHLTLEDGVRAATLAPPLRLL